MSRTSRQTGPGSALLPGWVAIRSRDGAAVRGDVLAGVTVAAYLVPQVLAYAEVAGMPPVTGLWAAGAALLVYAVLGSSRQLSIGPESTTALMTAVAVTPLAGGDPRRYAALAGALALLVGVICLLGRLARLGFLADLLSRPVLVGYLTGVAVIMIVSQLHNVTGVPTSGESVIAELRSFVANIGEVQLPTILLAGSVLAFLLIGSALLPRAPIPLVGVLLAAAATAVFSLSQHGVAVVGEVPSGFPFPMLPTVGGSDIASLVLPACGVAVVGYSDVVLTGRAFATRNRYPLDANQELVGLGGTNIAAGLFGGFPVSSSGSRTVIGDAMGSRSQLYSLAALIVLLVVVVVGGPILAIFPTAALGALVIYAALRLIDVGEFRRFAAFRWSELALALATVLAVLLLGVLYGVLAAVVLSILELLRRVSRPHDGILGYVPGVAGMHDVDDYPDAAMVTGLVVYRYDGPLCFANAENFLQRALAAVRTAPTPTEWFLLNAEANVEIDITAADALDRLREQLHDRGIMFAMARVKQDLRTELEASGLLSTIGDERIFPTLPTAVQAYRDYYIAAHGAAPAELPPSNPP